MTTHKHAEMIKAKADNMELVVFGNAIGGEWRECTFADLTIATGFYEFFLCLPQHKDACLHWLNGGDIEINRPSESSFLDWDRPSKRWSTVVSMMISHNQFRIKPKKEKRWIATLNGWNASQRVFPSKEEAIVVLGSTGYQFHEIEVEV